MSANRLLLSAVVLFWTALLIAFAWMLVGARDTSHAASYAPTHTAKYCNGLPADFPTSKPFTDADLAGNPACVEGSIPATTARTLTTTWEVATGSTNGGMIAQNIPGAVASDASIPNGQKVGGVNWEVQLGLLNGACIYNLQHEFALFDSATTGTPITPNGPATANRWGAAPSPIIDDAAPSPPGSTALDESADADSPFVTSNLSIYETLFTPSGGSYVPPLARYTGATRVPTGGDWQLASVFQVSAGALDAFMANGVDDPYIFGRVSHAPTNGTISLFVLNDPTATAIPISPIHDYCSPAKMTTMLLGTTPGGQTRYTTPSMGSYGISTFSFGLRDADQDGLENSIDTCPLQGNSGVDSDLDGIDNACDPGAPSSTDADGDGYSNRQDNCPLVSNNPNVDMEATPAISYLVAAPDGGPKGDQIGDACDPNPTTSPTEGGFEQSYARIPKCIGGTDADGDGFCSTQDVNDSDPGILGFTVNHGMDQEFLLLGDSSKHGDGWGGNHELYLGTDPLRYCAATSLPNDEPIDAHPMDLDDDGDFDPMDVLPLRTYFGQAVPSAPARHDLAPSKSINISDTLSARANFPIAVAAGNCLPGSTILPSGPTVGSVALDADTSGNDAQLSGGLDLQECAEVNVSGSVDIDVVVPPPGIPPDKLAAFEFRLFYDSSLVHVTGVDTGMLLAVEDSSGLAVGHSDAVPDSDGVLEVGAIEYFPLDGDESGPGVLARITLEGVGAGQTALVLQAVDLYSGVSGGTLYNLANVGSAAVAVGTTCVALSAGDADSDGIHDAVDELPLTASNGFRDRHGPGAETTGTIDATNGATVEVMDAPDNDADPDLRGVQIAVSGSGGPAQVTVCGVAELLPVGFSEIRTCVELDYDGDGVIDDDDNCPSVANPDQTDTDEDGQGDVCDSDIDGDGVLNGPDNCDYAPNPTQDNFDADSLGDACDPDSDADGVDNPDDACPFTPLGAPRDPVGCAEAQVDLDADGFCNIGAPTNGWCSDTDNCPFVTNADQANADGDSEGNACDADDDNDGLFDLSDNCPLEGNAGQEDYDGDGEGDACDTDVDDDGVANGSDLCGFTALGAEVDDTSGCAQAQVDVDGDGWCDAGAPANTWCGGTDNCPDVANADQTNTDALINPPGDSLGDVCDSDDDDDGFTDATEQEAGSNPQDPDSVPEVCGDGDDNDLDGLVDEGFSDIDGDTLLDCVDPDADGDFFPDVVDNCTFTWNPTQADINADGEGDACDDTDGDGVMDDVDNCLLLPSPVQTDTDGDGLGDECDADDDDDTIIDSFDNCPVHSNPGQQDLDGNGAGDACDDQDGDGIFDAVDNCLLVPNTDQLNADGDALGNACEPDDDADGTFDAIDGTWDGFAFTDESQVFSNFFTDQHLGGVTYGEILTRGTIYVQISELPNPDGVLIWGIGSGTAATVRNICDLTDVTVPANSAVVVSCTSSVVIEVILGAVTAKSGGVTASVPAGGKAVVETFQDGYVISNAADSGTPITVNGQSVTPGSEVDDRDNDGFLTPVEVYLGTDIDLACGPNAWPPDLVESNSVNIADVVALKPVFNTSVPPTSPRFDLAQGGGINIADVAAIRPHFNKSCTP